MNQTDPRYKKMEQYMTIALIVNLILFIFFLIAAGNGIIWLKVILFILTLLLSGLCLAFLYLSQELTKARSLWMSTAAAAIAVCLIFSLILNFPSPKPGQNSVTPSTSSTESIN